MSIPNYTQPSKLTKTDHAVERTSRGRRTVLTAELQNKICQFIRSGTYDYVAAEAVGISRRTFFEWVRRGEGNDEQRPCTPRLAEFARAVRLAQAEARATAEVMIKRTDPKWWLARMHRDQADAPGWSSTNAKPEVTEQQFVILKRCFDE